MNGPIQGKSTATDTIKGQAVNRPMHDQSTAAARTTVAELKQEIAVLRQQLEEFASKHFVDIVPKHKRPLGQ